MQKVAPDDPKNWDLHKFFTELYNYCFPIDYKQRTRLKLENLYQGPNQSVSEYVHELQEMFSMVGDIPTRFKIIKLWYSLKSKIQKVMWKDGLHPDKSTWEEVVAKAKMVSGCGKSGAWESPECGTELHWDTAESDFWDHGEYLQCRVRTWLQLMCCASVLELGVLISEWRT